MGGGYKPGVCVPLKVRFLVMFKIFQFGSYSRIVFIQKQKSRHSCKLFQFL